MIFIAVAARTRRRKCSYVFVVGASAADATVFAAVSAAALYNRFDRPGKLSRDRSGHVEQRCALLFFPSVAREAVEETVVGRSFVVGETSLSFFFLGLMPEFSSKPGTSTFAAIWSREGKLSGGVAARWTVPAQKALAVRAYCFFCVVRDDVTLAEEFLSVAVNPLRTVQAQNSLSVRAGGEGEAFLQVSQECRTCGVQFRVRAKAAFAANARTNASRLAVFSRLVVHDGLCVKPPQWLGDQIVAAAAATQPEFPRRVAFTTRVPPSAAVARDEASIRRAVRRYRRRRRKRRACSSAKRHLTATLPQATAEKEEEGGHGEGGTDFGEVEAAVLVFGRLQHGLGHLLGGRGKNRHAIEDVVLQNKKTLKHTFSFSLSLSLSHSLSRSLSSLLTHCHDILSLGQLERKDMKFQLFMAIFDVYLTGFSPFLQPIEHLN
jgi:hypothetical protein